MSRVAPIARGAWRAGIVGGLVVLITACGSTGDGRDASGGGILAGTTTIAPTATTVTPSASPIETDPISTAVAGPSTPSSVSPPAAPTTIGAGQPATTAVAQQAASSLTEADVAALERDLDELEALLREIELDLEQD